MHHGSKVQVHMMCKEAKLMRVLLKKPRVLSGTNIKIHRLIQNQGFVSGSRGAQVNTWAWTMMMSQSRQNVSAPPPALTKLRYIVLIDGCMSHLRFHTFRMQYESSYICALSCSCVCKVMCSSTQCQPEIAHAVYIQCTLQIASGP